jgi:hypothetical protein
LNGAAFGDITPFTANLELTMSEKKQGRGSRVPDALMRFVCDNVSSLLALSCWTSAKD